MLKTLTSESISPSLMPDPGTGPAPDVFRNMANDRPVALALVTQAQLDMLGGSLKIVFDVNDSVREFSDLLRAFDRPDEAETILPQLASSSRDRLA